MLCCGKRRPLQDAHVVTIMLYRKALHAAEGERPAPKVGEVAAAELLLDSWFDDVRYHAVDELSR